MPTFCAPDGTRIAYHPSGQGVPLVCLPGGPMQDSAYLGDLGGLAAHCRVILVDHRGTGQSATPVDVGSYRCDRLVADVDVLRERLGLERLNLLGHSAGTNLVVSYAARHPERIASLVLVTPSVRAVDLDVTADARRALVRQRAGEPWYGPAAAAFERINAGQPADGDWAAVAPFTYGRWDPAAQTHHARGAQQRNDDAAAVFGSAGAFDPAAIRAGLATLDAPVLLLAGELDVNSPPAVTAELAALFPNATLGTLPGGGHYPWLDDPAWFATSIAAFLG